MYAVVTAYYLFLSLFHENTSFFNRDSPQFPSVLDARILTLSEQCNKLPTSSVNMHPSFRLSLLRIPEVNCFQSMVQRDGMGWDGTLICSFLKTISCPVLYLLIVNYYKDCH